MLARALPISCLAVCLAVASLAVAQPPPPPEADTSPPDPVRFEVEGAQLVRTQGDVARRWPLPCAPDETLRTDARLYLICGEGGLFTVDLPAEDTDALVITSDGADVVGVFERGGQIWVERVRREAQPLDARASASGAPQVVVIPGPSLEGAPTPQAKPERPRGRVVEAREESVVIDLGAAAGVAKGDRIELFIEDDIELGDGQKSVRETRLAIGEVIAVSEQRSEVSLGLNEEVRVDTHARLTDAQSTATLMRPRRADGLWEITATLRPFLALGTLGAGMISDLSVGYRFEIPLHIAGYFEPIGLGFADEGNVIAMAGNVMVSYDTLYFEVGLGLGWSAINDTPTDFSLGAVDSGGGGETFERVRSGLSIAQIIRLGARDGLNLEARNGFLLVRDEFDYGGTIGSLQFPLTERWWLLLRGGGGATGFAYGEFALRILMIGNGERGSLFLTATIGGAGLWGEEESPCEYDSSETCINTVSYGGPMGGFGFEWRP